MKILIVGLGSMGKRRARLTKGIDSSIRIAGVDTAESRRAEATDLGLIDAAYPSIAEAVAAEAPDESSITVQQAVEQLTGEYRDELEHISDTVPHDRQEIEANDDVYYIRWQDVLAVFSSRVSGAEDGAPVAALDETRLDELREILWDMNEVSYTTREETVEVPAQNANTEASRDTASESTANDSGAESQESNEADTTTITQTVLTIHLTHKTPEEMQTAYNFTARQAEYLTLLQDPEYETLWAELLGGFAAGSSEILMPDTTHTPTAADSRQHHLAVRLPHRPVDRRNQLPRWHRHCRARRHTNPCRRGRNSHGGQRPRQLGRQLRLLCPDRPRQRPANPLCPLLPGLRHPRPAGTGRAGDRLRRPHRPRHGQPPAF